MTPDKSRARIEGCPIEELLDVIGGRWKVFILWWLQDGPKRTSELLRLIPTVTQKMLTQQLRELARDGLVDRRVYPSVPPRVEYRVTPTGASLHDLLAGMCHWSSTHIEAVRRARAGQSPDPNPED